MKQRKTFLLILIVTLFLTSCGDFLLSEEFQGDDWFYLENDKAVMPVFICGNKASNIFIIFLHGGPGGSSMDVPVTSAHKQLLKDYAGVYYDQRGSGAAQGNAQPESFTLEQFVEDLEKLVHLIRYKYNNPTLFLMGHSWGGGLGTAYLLNAGNQQYISGWIEIDGAHDQLRGAVLSFEWVKNKASEKVNSGYDAEYWQKELDWYNSTTAENEYNVKSLTRHVKNVEKLNGYAVDSSNIPGVLSLLNSPISIIPALLNSLYMQSNFDMKNKNLNMTGEMYKITIPVLILWGRHDGRLPVELAREAYDNLGTNNGDKYVHIFENSAHCPYYEEPELFANRVKEFIEKYK
jgi:pimeloyl-ACP methyl ester carboxylesterase